LAAVYTIWTVLCWCFLYNGRLLLLGHNSICFVTLTNTKLRLPEDDADASQHVGVLINSIYPRLPNVHEE